MELKVHVKLKIGADVPRVHKAITDPVEMTKYFISGSSGPIEAGKTLTWEWADHGAKGDVHIKEVSNNKIHFQWQAHTEMTDVVIALQEQGKGRTEVRITEDGWKKDDAGIKALASNTEGWTNFLLCLKAWVEHRVQLRQGMV